MSLAVGPVGSDRLGESGAGFEQLAHLNGPTARANNPDLPRLRPVSSMTWLRWVLIWAGGWLARRQDIGTAPSAQPRDRAQASGLARDAMEQINKIQLSEICLELLILLF